MSFLGCLLCRGIKKTLPYEHISLSEKYENLINEFEHEAIEVLAVCAEKNRKLSEDLLIRELPHWGKLTCLEVKKYLQK